MSISIETCQNEINKKSLLAGFFLFMRADRAKAHSEESRAFRAGTSRIKMNFIGRKPIARKSKAFSSGTSRDREGHRLYE